MKTNGKFGNISLQAVAWPAQNLGGQNV